MGERSVYYAQRHLACQYPDEYMSIILDGMAQNHCVLPWQCNLKQFSEPLDQHIQGLIEHGKVFRVFRSFHTVKDDFNLAAHCLLLSLEDRIQRKGRLPDTIFIRIDGGSENANKYLLALCEWIVAAGLTKKITLSRLPVGHTHEDIDGKFGNMWEGFKSHHILTPQVLLLQNSLAFIFNSTYFITGL